MVFMMKEVEKEEETMYNVFPMRNEVVPKHIRLDTTTLVHLLLTKIMEIKVIFQQKET